MVADHGASNTHSLGLEDLGDLTEDDVLLEQRGATHAVEHGDDWLVGEVTVGEDGLDELFGNLGGRSQPHLLASGLTVDADPQLHLVLGEVEGRFSGCRDRARGECHTEGTSSLVDVLGQAHQGVQVLALLGGGIAALVVHTIGTAGDSGASMVRLVLAGAVVAAVLNAYVQAVALSLPRHFDNYRFWVVGSLGDGGLDQLRAVAPFVVVGLALALLCASSLNALALGSETAAGLGVSTTLVRTAALGAATLLCAAATAAVGPIAFIGLAVPHIVRGLLGLDMRRQLIGCLLVGPVVLLGADVVGRVLLRPQELMVGVVTAFVGAPILLLAVRRLGRRAQA